MPRMESYIYYATGHKYWNQNFRLISQSAAAFLNFQPFFFFVLGGPVFPFCSHWNLKQHILSNIGLPLRPGLPVLPHLFLQKAKSKTMPLLQHESFSSFLKKRKIKHEWALVKALLSCSPLCTGPAGHRGCRCNIFRHMIYVSRTQVV